jgi:hypothetical protein
LRAPLLCISPRNQKKNTSAHSATIFLIVAILPLTSAHVGDLNVTTHEPACPGTVHQEPGCGSTGAIVFNASGAAECCQKCGGYSCATWTFGGTKSAENGFPPHNCAIMSTYLAPRPVADHSCGVMIPAPVPTPKHPTPPPAPTAYPPCNADISCDLYGGANWRCSADKSKSGPAANCHIAGPGTAGSASCSCKPAHCGALAPFNKTAGAKQYLMMGDSISLGMKTNVFTNLTKHGIQGRPTLQVGKIIHITYRLVFNCNVTAYTSLHL